MEVAKPNIGENRPSRVRADVTLTLGVRPEIKEEWQGKKKTREISASLTLFHSFETTRRLVFDYVSNAVKPRRRSRRIVQRKGNVVARDSLKLAFAFV